MRWASFASLVCVLSLGAVMLPANAGLVVIPGVPDVREGIDPRMVPEEIRESFSQAGVASFSRQVLEARSAELRDRVVADPENPYPFHALGTVTFHLGGEREAQALWGSAAHREPNLAPADVMYATHTVFRMLEAGDAEAAQTALAETERRFEAQPHFQLIRAEQAMRGGNLPAAEAAFTRAHELGPELYVTALNLGRFREFVQASPDTILPLYLKAAELAPNRSETWLYLGNLQARLGREDEALASFRQLQALLPDARLPEWQIADLRLGAGDAAGAERWYRRALATQPPELEQARIRAALGDVLLRLGLTAEARKEIEAALAVEELPALVFALATLDEADGDTAAAERGYRRILQYAPGHPLAANNLAMLLIREDRAANEALALAAQARKGIPGNAIIEGTYGCALSQRARHQEAVETLRPVIAAIDDDAWAHYCLGQSLAALGDREAAGREFARVAEIDPGFPRRLPNRRH